ncbi:efflux RND transporter periplasmic adaptor subunit [Massilia sp. YIM B04103]|uniref:efflux RND transporter periplasmic adaptor subunit n=1 Tax=Massilia sp. YIM B04103 TaxID=2963106 RepID=UPI00210E8064|nr:efflux RND transporter periplasmic adaptor subunit [Massilia sp. YIM B04103]
MSKQRIAAPAALLPLAALLSAALTACVPSGNAASGPPPLPVVGVAHPASALVAERLEYTGRIEPAQRVEVRSRVAGYLAAIKFRDGQAVKQGDPLFVIDQRPFLAARDRARASLAQAKARQTLAAAQLQRLARTHETGASSAEELDRARAEADGAQAAVMMAQAELRNAELELEFSTITAPISGKLSDRRADVGNYVAGGAAQGAPLTTIVSLSPVRVTVDITEADFQRLRRQPRLPEQVQLQFDGAAAPLRADIDFIDNEASSKSGTVRVRASLPNLDHALLPGYFARVSIAAAEPQPRLTVPDAAIQSEPLRKLVLVVDAEGKVAPRAVQLGGLVGAQRVVLAGLSAQDQVIVSGAQRVKPGERVQLAPAAKAKPGSDAKALAPAAAGPQSAAGISAAGASGKAAGVGTGAAMRGKGA